MLSSSRKRLVEVLAYLWLEGEAVVLEVPALEYWPSEGERGGSLPGVPVPTHERLATGEVRPMPRYEGRAYFLRARHPRRPP